MKETRTTTYSVPEISCGHCESSIKDALAGLDGVSGVAVDIEAKNVIVDGGDTDAIIAAIEDVGFDVAR